MFWRNVWRKKIAGWLGCSAEKYNVRALAVKTDVESVLGIKNTWNHIFQILFFDPSNFTQENQIPGYVVLLTLLYSSFCVLLRNTIGIQVFPQSHQEVKELLIENTQHYQQLQYWL